MATVVEYLNIHRKLTTEVIDLYRCHAALKMQELEARKSLWESSQETTIRGRELSAEYSALPFTVELLKSDGEIKGILAEIKHVELCLGFMTASNQRSINA